MKITRKSMSSGQVNTREIDVTQAQLDAWQNGEKIQDAMPNVPAEEREFILTGTTPEEWDELFSDELEVEGEDDEEDSDDLS
jgi:hypothetical protein